MTPFLKKYRCDYISHTPQSPGMQAARDVTQAKQRSVGTYFSFKQRFE